MLEWPGRPGSPGWESPHLERPRKGSLGVMRTPQTTPRGTLLETHFDETTHHTRSASYSSMSQHQVEGGGRHATNLNASFPSTEVPYISSSVTLPVSEAQPSLYQNVSGRIRQEQTGNQIPLQQLLD